MTETLKKRLITAGVLIPMVLIALFAPTVWMWRVVVTVFVGVGWWEWVRLSKATDQTAAIVISSSVLLGLSYIFSGLGYSSGVVIFSIALWVIAIAVCYLAPSYLSEKLMPQSKLIFGAWVLAVSWWGLIWLREQENGVSWLLGFLVVIWLADTGAYFTGKRFGKRKLAPAISPGKTIEGLMGGAACVAVYAFIIPGFYVDSSRFFLAILAVIIAVTSVGGDLLESWLKRQANMKDSSQVLPGHGGVLDRIDSLIATIPMMVLAYQILAK